MSNIETDNMEKESYVNCNLELGDIIEIESSDNTELHEKMFYILYIDDDKTILTHIDTNDKYTLTFDEDGNIKDESIESIKILSRSEDKGYALQNGLSPKTWVDLHFGGETPVIITGEITNLEEDMIEITTFPDLDVIYIDFGYKGIPEHLPIEKIVLRSKPSSLQKIESIIGVKEQLPDGVSFDPEFIQGNDDSRIEYQPNGEFDITLPQDVESDKTLKEELHVLYNSANQIAYGKDLDDIVSETEIPEHKRRNGIETQVNDMLDVFLSEIPEFDRTHRTMDNIHHLIQRFKELRTKFSKFDEHNNIYDVKSNGRLHKPLVNNILNLDKQLKWVLPVVTLKKKIYLEDKNTESDGFKDVSKYNISDEIVSDATLQEDYYKNRLQRNDESLYVKYHQSANAFTKPFTTPDVNEMYLSPENEVNTAIESIVDNLENFNSTVIGRHDDMVNYMRRKYIIQRYNLGDSYLEPEISKAGKKVYTRSKMNNNEKATVKSVMFLPKQVIEFSAVDLPGTDILKKSTLGENYMYMFKLLNRKHTIDNNMIDNFDEEMDQKFWEIPMKDRSFYKNSQNYILAESIEQSPDRFRKYLQTIIPDTQNIVRLFDNIYDEKHHNSMLSLHSAVKKLEPFMVYMDDINYSQYNALRYFIKTKRTKYLSDLSTSRDDYRRIVTTDHSNSIPYPNRVESLFNEKKSMVSVLLELYQLIEYKSSNVSSYTSTAEWLKRMYSSDNSELFGSLIRLMMISLITPENISDALKIKADESEDLSKYDKIKASDCSRRVLVKKYNLMKDLQKDNGTDVFYDKDFDDTPYDIMKKYKDEVSKYSNEDLKDFLEEVLIQKHDCPPKMAPEMAENLIQGSKFVRDGEYAMLELLPHLKEKSDTEFSDKEKDSIIDEANILKKTVYYKRVNNQWIQDESVDENVFIDSNTLFCNMSKICFRDTKKNICENLNDTEKRLKITQRKQLINEFDERYEESYEGLEERLQKAADKLRKMLNSKKRLTEVQHNRYNDYAFQMGRFVKENDTIKSPHLSHMEDVLGQTDFIKKQHDILKFAELYCRDPMVAELGDSPYYLYCVDTNKPLLPTSLFKLAQAFVSKDDYMGKLSEICRKQGRINGDIIEDEYTGRELRKIDFVGEDGFDEQGFRMVTNEVIEKDVLETTVTDQKQRKLMKDRVFDNADTQLIFKLYRTIIGHIGIKTDDIEEFVLRHSVEFINDPNVIKSERIYKLDAIKIMEEKKKRVPPYEIYRNKLIILIVTSIILVGIQTAIPSFKIQKTFPGCVQSFKGFPESAEETGGIDYLVCILNTLKDKSSKPWNSIKPLPIEILKQQLIQIIDQLIKPRGDIMDLYVKKSEYMREHPDYDIPKEHGIQKWLHFMPPVVDFSIEKQLKGLPSDYKTDLLEMIKTGNQSQQKQLDMFKTKSVLFSYGVIENVNRVIRDRGLLLKTASGVYFTENACCNDKITKTAMDYFIDDNKELLVYLKMVKGWGEVIENVKQYSRAPFIFDPRKSGLTYTTDEQTEHFEKNIYIAFIRYCNLDSDIPIPEDLHGLMSEKMHDYPAKSSLMEKIDFLKQNGKRLNNGNLLQLMNIVNKRNLVDTKQDVTKGTRVSGLQDLLAFAKTKYADNEDAVLCDKFCELMEGVLDTYNPKTLVAEDSEATYKLNNWLAHANSNLLERITNFISKTSNLNRRKMSQFEEQLANIHIWNMDSTYEYGKGKSMKDETNMYSITQFMKQSVFFMSRVYPEMIINQHTMSDKSHKHWGFAQPHNMDVSNFIQSYYKELSQFKKDESISSLLKYVQETLIHVHQFLDLIPAFLPIHRGPQGELPAQSYYSLFSKRTLYMIHSYIWYSVIYEFIKATDNEELLQLSATDKNKIHREKIQEERERVIGTSTEILDRDPVDEYGDLLEIEIQVGNKDALHKQIGNLLVIFINMDISNKKAFDLSYRDIEKRITRSKLNEKKMITDFLKNIDDDERRVEDTQKMLKLGRWNVGLKKGLVEYNKERYTEERNQLFDQLANNADYDMNDIVIQKDAAELDAEEVQDAEQFYEDEANDLRGYAGADGDGQYYEEDAEDDFGED